MELAIFVALFLIVASISNGGFNQTPLGAIWRYICLPFTGRWYPRRDGLATYKDDNGILHWVRVENWEFTDDQFNPTWIRWSKGVKFDGSELNKKERPTDPAHINEVINRLN